METTLLAVAGLAIVGLAGMACAVILHRRQRSRRTLMRHPATPIGEVKLGRDVKICGEVAPLKNQLEAPLTGRQCVMFHVRVRRQIADEQGVWWDTVADELAHVDFLVVDTSGRARVHPDGVDTMLIVDAHFDAARQPRLRRYLAAHARQLAVGQRVRGVHFEERALEAGDRVAVLGRATFEPDPEPNGRGGGYRTRPQRLVLVRPDSGSMLLSEDRSVFAPPTQCSRCGSKALFQGRAGETICASCVCVVREG